MKEEAEAGVIGSQASDTVEPPEAGRSKRGSPLRAHKGRDCSGPADTLILDFRPPELSGNTFLFFKATTALVAQTVKCDFLLWHVIIMTLITQFIPKS